MGYNKLFKIMISNFQDEPIYIYEKTGQAELRNMKTDVSNQQSQIETKVGLQYIFDSQSERLPPFFHPQSLDFQEFANFGQLIYTQVESNINQSPEADFLKSVSMASQQSIPVHDSDIERSFPPLVQKSSMTKYVMKPTSKKSQKNTNFPKFLIRLTQKYFQSDAKDVISSQFKIKKMGKMIRRRSRNNKPLNLSTITNIVSSSPGSGLQPFYTRKILHHLLGKRKREQISLKSKLKNKSLYLNALKVFRLRCRCQQLCSRGRSH